MIRAVTTEYDDRALSIKTTQDDTTPLVSWTYLDPLGRVRLKVDPAGNKVQKAYRFGSNGVSYELTSNPYTAMSDGTMGWQLTTQQLSTPTPLALTVTSTSYGGNTPPVPWGSNAVIRGTSTRVVSGANSACPSSLAAVSTDEAGLVVRQCSDALGRTVAVQDPNGVVTQHGYDQLDNVIQVTVDSQTRVFEYSSLSRLLKACNPESGTATCVSPLANTGLEKYEYDPNGNLTAKTDARGIITRYSGYDVLNRPTTKSFKKVVNSQEADEGTPQVTWTYDQDFKGALSGVSITRGTLTYSTSYTHDGFGRTTGSVQSVAGTP